MEQQPPTLFFRKENTIAGNFHIKGVLYSGRERYLNSTATRIVELYLQSLSVEDVVVKLQEEYDAPYEVIYKDVVDFLSDLESTFGFSLGSARVKFIKSHIPFKPLMWFLSAPIEVYLELTYRCNLRCIHCYACAGERYGNELTTQEVLSLLDELQDLGVFRIAIGGGEPLLRNDFLEIVTKALSMGFIVDFSTNGWFLTNEILEELCEAGVKSIQISLDGSNSVIHDKIRSSGSFRRAVDAIKRCKDYGFTVNVRTTVQVDNVFDLKNLLLLLKRLKVDFWTIAELIPSGRALENRLIVSRKKFEDSLSKLKSEGNPKIIRRENLVPKARTEDEKVMCPAGFSSVAITPYGMVKPCSFFPDRFNVGNIRNSSLKELWYEGEIFKTLRSLTRSNMLEPCKSCGISCDGGCRAAAASVYGKINAPDPLCPYSGWFK